MAKVNNYPYTNMIYQNIDWLVDSIGESSETAEKAMQIAQETALRVDGKVDKTDVAHQVYATDEHGNDTTLYYNTGISSDSLVQRTSDGRIRASLPVTDVDVTNKEYVDSIGSSKVDKAGVPRILYGTDNASREVGLAYSQGANVNTIAQRTEDGTIRTNPPVNNFDAANKKYVDKLKWTTVLDDTLEEDTESNTINYTNFPSVDNCEGIKIYTIIDNGDTNPTIYNSTDLDISINNEFYFSIDGAVPQSSSQRRVQEDTEVKSWDWSSFGFGDVSYVALSKVFSSRTAFQNAEVSITSTFSGRTFDYQYDIGEEEITIDSPGFRGHQVKFVQQGGDTIYGVYLTQVYAEAPGVVPGQVIFNGFLPTTDVSEFGSGYWTYKDTTAEHKIATGSLETTFINSELAETTTAGSGTIDEIEYGTVIPAANIKHYAMHPAEDNIHSIQIHLSNGTFREGTRFIVRCKGEV